MPKTYIIVKILIIFFLLAFSTNLIINQEAKGSDNILWVDDDYQYPSSSDGSISKPYTNIQDAIDASENGNRINVLQGEYNADLNIDKSVTITAESYENTVIRSASKTAYFIEITADNVSLENFKIWENTTTSHRKAAIYISENADYTSIIGNWINISRCGYFVFIENNHDIVIKDNIVENTKGIKLVNADINCITNNTFYNRPGYNGIELRNSKHNIIEYNILTNCNHGIFLNNCQNNKIYNNTIHHNDLAGIKILDGKKNFFENNSIYENIYGMDIESPFNFFQENKVNHTVLGFVINDDSCVINNNTFWNCSSYSIYAGKGSEDNIIYNNTFRNKTGLLHAKDNGENLWYNISSKTGNFWDDFFGPDPSYENNLDSLKETDFFYSKDGIVDKYPTGVFQKPPIIRNPYPVHLSTGVNPDPSLSVVVYDFEDDYMNVYFYQIKNNSSELISEKNNVRSGTNVSVKLLDPGTYIGEGYDYICEWYVIVEDEFSINNSDVFLFSTSDVPIKNKPPMVETSGPYAGIVNQKIFFNGNTSYDPDGEIIFHRWNFGDGTTVTSSLETAHKFKNPGLYNGYLMLIDNNGSVSKSSFTVNVSNGLDESISFKKLTCSIIPSKNNSLGVNENLDLFAKIKGGINPYNLSWNVKGKNFVNNSQNISISFNESGDYFVNLSVIDEFGNKAFDNITLRVFSVNSEKSKDFIKDSQEEIPGFELVFLFFSLLIYFFINIKEL